MQMPLILQLTLTFVVVGAMAALFVGQWIRVSRRANIMDVPTHRSSHVKATPRGGGVGIVTVVLGATGAFAWIRGAEGAAAAWFCGLSAVIAGVSLVDDLRSLPSLGRLALHLGVAMVAIAVFGAFNAISAPFLGAWSGPAVLMYGVTLVWIVGVTNIYNFMDGIDGIAGAQGVVAGLAWTWWGAHSGSGLVCWIGLALAASCAGFLVHNWSPARVFMGDVGSAFLGVCFGLLPLLAQRASPGAGSMPLNEAGAVPVFASFVLWPFLADGAFTFLRRLRKRENVLAAHRTHLYQRLTIAGWPHAKVSLLYAGWAGLSAVAGAIYIHGVGSVRLTVAGLMVLSLVAVHALVKSRERGRTLESPISPV